MTNITIHWRLNETIHNDCCGCSQHGLQSTMTAVDANFDHLRICKGAPDASFVKHVSMLPLSAPPRKQMQASRWAVAQVPFFFSVLSMQRGDLWMEVTGSTCVAWGAVRIAGSTRKWLHKSSLPCLTWAYWLDNASPHSWIDECVPSSDVLSLRKIVPRYNVWSHIFCPSELSLSTTRLIGTGGLS